MKMLEDRIRKDGIVREGNVLKVDSFINHQMDIPLFREMAKEWKRLFDGKPINKVLTIEASGIGWQGRYEQAELMARFFKAQAEGSPRADALRQAKAGPQPDLSGGFKYLKLERMAYYVHKDTYRNAVRAASAALA